MSFYFGPFYFSSWLNHIANFMGDFMITIYLHAELLVAINVIKVAHFKVWNNIQLEYTYT